VVWDGDLKERRRIGIKGGIRTEKEERNTVRTRMAGMLTREGNWVTVRCGTKGDGILQKGGEKPHVGGGSLRKDGNTHTQGQPGTRGHLKTIPGLWLNRRTGKT